MNDRPSSQQAPHDIDDDSDLAPVDRDTTSPPNRSNDSDENFLRGCAIELLASCLYYGFCFSLVMGLLKAAEYFGWM